MSKITIEALLEQAQVFASAWSLVDGPFDHGGQLQAAENEKEVLQDLLEQFEEQVDSNAAHRDLQDIAQGLVDWHAARLRDFDTVLETPSNAEIRLGSDDSPLILSEEQAKGFRIAMGVAKHWIEKFPLSIERRDPVGEEQSPDSPQTVSKE